jgi:hypothetical protein
MLKFITDEDIYYSEALCYFDVTVSANETYTDFVLDFTENGNSENRNKFYLVDNDNDGEGST